MGSDYNGFDQLMQLYPIIQSTIMSIAELGMYVQCNNTICKNKY